ncbi:MAG TPA: FAD-dependent oxidoreductase, partial [Magnetococcales bacterium]|nr:FAD-dependent oxidoreductase [Magnetococcales bacterium]
MSMLNRRTFVKLSGAAALVGLSTTAFSRRGFAADKGRVVVIGGGYGGSIAAKYIRMADPGIEVTLIEQNPNYYSCPMSNWVVAGFRDLEVQKWGYE